MDDLKITQLPVATAVNASDLLPIVQSGTTKQAAASLIGTGVGIGGSIANQQVAFGNGTDIAGSDNFKFISATNALSIGNFTTGDLFIGQNAGGIPSADSTAIGDRALASSTGFGANTAVGKIALTDLTTGSNNVAVGDSAGAAFIEGSNNVAIGSAAAAGGSDANDCIAIGGGTDVSGTNVITIGAGTSNSNDNTALIGNGDITDISFGDGSATVHAGAYIGNGSQLIFSDSDPHIAGAGYWAAGVLTRSNG